MAMSSVGWHGKNVRFSTSASITGEMMMAFEADEGVDTLAISMRELKKITDLNSRELVIE